MGTILVERGALAEGHDCYATAVQIEPRFLPALNNLAVVLQRLGQLRAAEARYREVLHLAPKNLEIQLNFAALQAELGRYRPIFVFGMPRSGTSLVEQILASHPLIYGAGEPTHLRDIAGASDLRAWVPDLAPEDLAALGCGYLDLVGADVPDTLRLVDKMPSNFLHAGLISPILSGARMIHCRRDPLHTCLSCYSLLFRSGHEYSYDLGEFGRFYLLYRGLMAHWRRILPPKSLLEIDYETLVHETEGEVRKILDFCGLPWDAVCLRFHETSRRVRSASLDQVRSPVYTKTVGRAQLFRPWLGALEAALADLSAV